MYHVHFQNQSKYSVCSYSKCGKYLAAGTEKGDFSIWDIDANKLISEDKSDDTEAQCITAIDWNPNMDSLEFAYTDNTGQFGLIENIGDSDENMIDRDDELAVDDDINFGDRMSLLYTRTPCVKIVNFNLICINFI